MPGQNEGYRKKLKRVVCGIWIPLVGLLLLKTDVEQAEKNGCMNGRMDGEMDGLWILITTYCKIRHDKIGDEKGASGGVLSLKAITSTYNKLN